MKKFIPVIIFVLILALAGVAVATEVPMKYGKGIPYDNPYDTMNQYNGLLAKGQYDEAYGMLSAEVKKGLTVEQYKEMFDTATQSLYTIKNASATLTEQNLEAVNAVRYAEAAKFNIKTNYLDGRSDKQVTEESTLYTVAENNVWKVHFPNSKIAYQNSLVTSYTRLGLMYGSGNKVAQDKDKALEYFFKALKLDKTNSLLNANVALIYLDKGQYKDGLKYIGKAEKRAADDNELVNILCIKGALYASKGDKDKANDIFDKAAAIEDTLPETAGRVDVVENFRSKFLK